MLHSPKVVFINNQIGFAKRQIPLAEGLRKKGLAIQFVTYSKEAEEFLKSKGEKVTNIINEFKKINVDNYHVLLMHFEKKYHCNTNLLLTGDYNHSLLPIKVALKSLARHFIFWEWYLTQEKPSFILNGVERFVNEVPRLVCQKFSTDFYVWKTQPIVDTFIITKDHVYWDELKENWREIKERHLKPEEKKKAQEYINKVIMHRQQAYLVFKPPKIAADHIKYNAKRIWVNLYTEKLQNPYAHLPSMAKHQLGVLARKHISKLWHKKPRFGKEKFFFYPIHREIDAQILVRAPQYKNQVELIKIIARHLPYGYKLYVEEHPNGIGEMELKKLKELSKIYNVRLLSPKTSALDLIKNCEGIVTINSTVGWEALLFEKPVIQLGRSFYELSGLTYRVKDLYDLPDAFRWVIDFRGYDREVVLKFVYACLRSVHDGKILIARGRGWDQYLEPSNINKVINAIAQKFKIVLKGEDNGKAKN